MARNLEEESSGDTEFIKASCETTSYPDRCFQSLSSYASEIKKQPRKLAETALAVSIARAKSAKTYVSEMTDYKGITKRQHEAVADCLEEMGDTVDRLSNSLKELKHLEEGDSGEDFWFCLSNVRTWTSAALTDETACMDGFGGKAMAGELKSLIRAFWGVEVKPGKTFTLKNNEATGIRRLHLSQATLGHGTATNRSILQCNVGNKSPLLLCVLTPDKVDSCQLNLEFEETDEVIFSVIGPRSVHLTGYFLGRSTGFRPNDDESESFGEDIVDTDMEKGSSDDYDYSDSFINDDDPAVRGSHVSSTDDDEISIKEMTAKTKEKKKNGKGRRLRKKFQVSDSDSDETSARADESSNEDSVEVLNNGNEPKIAKVHSSESPLPSRVTRSKARKSTLESGEPAKCEKTFEAKINTHKTLDNREDKPLDDAKLSPVQKDCEILSKKKRNKERSKSSAIIIDSDDGEGKNMPESLQNENPVSDKGIKSSSDVLLSQNGDATLSKKKKKRDRREETTDVPECPEKKKQAIDKNIEKEAGTKKPLETRTLSNGVIIEDIEKGKLDGKSAVKGKKVSILYTGKLKDTGNLFDSNLGEDPLRFRLGGENVIEGLSIGVEGMRVGDKRRLIIPPALGYSKRGLKEKVPKSAWLVYEVEAVKIR